MQEKNKNPALVPRVLPVRVDQLPCQADVTRHCSGTRSDGTLQGRGTWKGIPHPGTAAEFVP